MSVPEVIFIDTSVFDEQRYNFQSAAITAFLESLKGISPTLLLPDPTEREINRHITDQVDAAKKAAGEARRKAPILAMWPGWPATFAARDIRWQLLKFAREQWEAFLKHFKIQRLGYDNVSLPRIMNWYEFKRAPFGAGKKSKEFPDAIAVDAIASYAGKQNTAVCIVSKDADFKNACAHYSGFMHFSSLPALTEAILSGDTRVAALRTLLGSNLDRIERKIEETFPDCSFYPEDDPMGDVADVDIHDVAVLDFNVIALGECECRIAFDARISYSASVTVDDPDSVVGDSEDGYFAWRRLSGTVSNSIEMSGISKLHLEPGDKSVVEVVRLEFDRDDVCVAGPPDDGWKDDSPDDYSDEDDVVEE
jgi:hypothetical protein